MAALLLPAVSAVPLSCRPRAVASEALQGVLPTPAGRFTAHGFFGRIAEQASVGFFQPAAPCPALEKRPEASHRVPSSVLTVRGNRASLAGIVATSADLPNLAAQEA